tara:strand:+ start:594 stop:1328 length:735 start_codon:yes stop_codon:yes gene_type:complete
MAGFGNESLILRGPTGITDQSVNGNNGTYNGGMGVVADTSNSGVSAFSLTSASSQYINITSAPELKPTSTLTIACWLRIDAWVLAGIVGSWDVGTNSRQYSLRMTGTTGLISFALSDDGAFASGHRAQVDATGLSLATWYFVVAEFDSGTPKLSINNAASAAPGFNDITSIYSASDDVIIGGEISSGTVVRFFGGRIDDVRILNRVLTSGEKSAWYAAGRGYDVATGNPAGILQLNTQSMRFGL